MQRLFGFERSWSNVAVVASASAAALHFAAVRPHAQEWLPAGVFMFAAGTVQLAWAVWMVRRGSDMAALAGVVVNAGIVAVWVVSRTAGLPFGPEAGMPESIHGPDALAAVLEAGAIGACFAGLRQAGPRRWLMLPAAAGALLAVVVSADDPARERLTALSVLALAWAARSLVLSVQGPIKVRRKDVASSNVRSAAVGLRPAGRAVMVVGKPGTR